MKEEMGNDFERLLGAQHANRYWKVKLGYRWRIFLARIFFPLGLCFYAIVYVVLVLAAWAVALSLGRPRRQGPLPPEYETALASYRGFLEIYPTSIYLPVVKSIELGFFKTIAKEPPLLEIGVGDGSFSERMFAGCDTDRFLGGDLVPETIFSAQEKGVFKHLAVMDADEVPLPSASAATVLMNNLIHHVPARLQTLREIGRVLKTGGCFVFTDNLSGWIENAAEYRFLKALKLESLARRYGRWKLDFLMQSLIPDASSWEKLASEEGWEMVRAQEFIGPRVMFWCHLFELLNLKQGRAAWGPLERIISVPFFRRAISGPMGRIVEVLLVREGTAMEGRGAYLFVCLRKKVASSSPTPAGGDGFTLVCPVCRGALVRSEFEWSCSQCRREYPLAKGIPILLSYVDRLNGLSGYLNRYVRYSREKRIKKIIT